MSDEQKQKESEVFDQELSVDELDAAAGGLDICGSLNEARRAERDKNNCAQAERRLIYGGGGFPNCAATVEDGSWCETNDACYNTAVNYQGLTDCKKAWR